MAKLPKKLKDQMASALADINELLQERREQADAPPEQETNIFRILKLENHEIRHGAFLDYLLDPERNVQLAHNFAHYWLESIADDIGLNDSAINDIIDGKDFEISPIEGEHKYSEILVRDSGKLRIDHALELKVGNRRRALVFEYKHNGVVQNDLDAYQAFVEKRYPGKYSEVYFFILDLGDKVHTEEREGGFRYLNKDTLITALENTLEEAHRRDMQATRMYLEQYLEILNPEVENDFVWRGMERLLWDMWNPKISEYDDALEIWETLVDELISHPDDEELLDTYYESDLFSQRVIQTLSQEGIDTRRNSQWARVKLPRNQYQNFYLTAWLCFNDNGPYLAINLSCWQEKNTSEEIAEAQYGKLLDLVTSTKLFAGLTEALSDIENYKRVWWSSESKVLSKVKRRDSSRRKFDMLVSLQHPVSLEDLKAICAEGRNPPVFEAYVSNLMELFSQANQK